MKGKLGTNPIIFTFINSFDEEQIWSQLETFQKPMIKFLSNKIDQLSSLETLVSDDVLELLDDDSEEEENGQADDQVDERALRRAMTNDDSEEEQDEEEQTNLTNKTTQSKSNKPKTNDPRYYIADESEVMVEENINKFLDNMESNMDELDELDYADNEAQESGADMYGEMYGLEDEMEDDEEEDQETSGKTPFELEQERLLAKMEEFEEKNIADKDWQEVGEVDAKKRPQNSLVEEGRLTFEHAHKAKPVITEEVTRDLESIIISRIVSGIYDDPVKPEEADKAEDLKQDVQLEHEKSKKSLAQIYEEMYMKKVEGVDIEEEKKEDPLVKSTKQRVLKQVSDLLRVLNQMSTFTYVAPPRIDLEDESESKSLTNITTGREESEKSASEILSPVKWLPQSNEELSEQDKKRKRRQIKEKASKKNKKANELVDKLNPGSAAHATKLLEDIEKRNDNVKNERATKLEDASAVGSDKLFSSSKQFFNKIQDNIKKIHGAKLNKKSGHFQQKTPNGEESTQE